ncbi:hypothetical protein BZA70DRAFT_175058 [Myxozyma melibiosi]|uniref:Zn(2)-C6 fungal-type domain-containing protein n=1 Tax=Myxozyma melibiosi TaxID=54550 RepID=A0ABR1F7Q8_9ASCO
MVGVAGGSRGCPECRRRRVKCDETHPHCNRCSRVGLKCSGPVTGLRFKIQRVEKSSSRPDRTLTTKTATSQNSEQLSKTSRTLDFSRKDRRQWPHLVDRYKTILTNRRLHDLELFPEFDLFSHCVSLFLSTCRMVGRASSESATTLWLLQLPAIVLSPINSATTFAGRALVLGHCAGIVGSDDIRMMSYNWYVEAIRLQKTGIGYIMQGAGDKLVEALEAYDIPEKKTVAKVSRLMPDSGYSSGVVNPPSLFGGMTVCDDCTSAALLLPLYEMSNTTNSNALSKMLQGAVILMELQGPEKYYSGNNHVLLEGTLYMQAINAAFSRNAGQITLNLPQWQACRAQTYTETMYHGMIKYMFEIGELQIEANRLFDNILVGFGKEFTKQPSLKPEFLNADGWWAVKELHRKLCVLDMNLEICLAKCLEDYLEALRAQDPRTLIFDEDTRFPQRQPKICPAAASYEEWKSSHFGKPQIDYEICTSFKFMGSITFMQMIIAYLHCYTVPAAYCSYEELTNIDKNPFLKHSLNSYIAHRKQNLERHNRTLLRSIEFTVVEVHRPVFMFMMSTTTGS